MTTYISSLSHLDNYLVTQGVKVKKVANDTLQVNDGLFLVYNDNYVIPTGYDNGFLNSFTNNISNMLITYLCM